jgi:two-component system cell cycle sensor histidine kinase/response regulator CckA
VRELTARALRRAGYEVIEASDGADALARVADPSVRVDLLVTDAVMPTMGGTELASRVRERRGALRVLFVSGYARDQRTEEVRDASFLSKPFTIDTLLGAVRAVLDAPAV